MEVLLKMTFLDGLIFGLGLLAHAPLIVGLFWEKNDLSQTFFTWFVYFVLDTITMLSAVKIDGNYIMLFSFACGSIIMAGILFIQGRICWTWHETIVSILIVLCGIVWHYGGPYPAMVAGILSEAIIGGYLAYRTAKYPRPKYNLLGYSIFLLVSILSTVTAKGFNFKQVAYGTIEIMLCVLTIIPLIREFRRQKSKN